MIKPATTLTNNKTVIIDTGVCNLTSVYQAMIRVTDNVVVTNDHDQIGNAARVILPGVGTAPSGMKALADKHLLELIPNLTQPVLGICLGMQLLATSSTEANQRTRCLGVIPTHVSELDSKGQSLPHMGWNKLLNFDVHPIFNGLDAESYCYFVHSYCVPQCSYTIASCDYGEQFSAGISHNNFIGLQFHPEKSGAVGSKILSNFSKMR